VRNIASRLSERYDLEERSCWREYIVEESRYGLIGRIAVVILLFVYLIAGSTGGYLSGFYYIDQMLF
jgi:hypothetical protein